MFMFGLFTAAAFIASAKAAKLTNTPQDFVNVKAGQPFTLTWTEASGPVTILLKNGPSTNLKTVTTLASGQTSNAFTWTPDTTLPEDQYAIEIIDSGAPNYSVQFPISGGSSAPSSASSTTTEAPSYSFSSPADVYPSSSHASSGYSSGTGNATSSVHYTGTSASARPTSPANATSSSYSSSFSSAHSSTSKPTPTTLPDTSLASGKSSSFALLLLSTASFMFFLWWMIDGTSINNYGNTWTYIYLIFLKGYFHCT